MSNAYLQGAKDLKKLGVQFKGLLALVPELERVGSLEQAATEAEGRHKKALADQDEAQNALKKAKKQIAGYKEDASKVLDDAKAKKSQILEEANMAAEQIVEGAQNQAAGILDEAAAQRAKLDATLSDSQARLKALKVEIADLEKQRDKVNKEVAVLQKRLTGVLS